jgi:drug/metabolite transporter (DMT)-like permease
MLPAFIIPALAAYFLLAVVGLMDKVLLKTAIVSPRAYAFYVGALSSAAVVLLPFGVVELADFCVLLAALASGVASVYALWAFYSALKVYEASRVITAVGALVPIFTLIFSVIFLDEQWGFSQLVAFALLVLGGVLISREGTVQKSYTFELLWYAVWAAVLFAVSFTVLRFVYLSETFFTGFFWTRMGGVLGALTIIAVPENFKRIFWATKRAPKSTPLRFIFNQVTAGAGAILQSYAIFLGSAALVGALQGVQYAFLLILVISLSRYFPQIKEEFSRRAIIQKVSAIVLIAIGLVTLSAGSDGI